jgi:hypothetical protein
MAQKSRSLLATFEIARIKLLVEVSFALFSDIVEAAGNPFKQAILCQFWTTVSSGSRSGSAQIFDRGRRQIAVLSDKLQYPVIGWDHPFGTLTHVTRGICGNEHTNTDYRQLRVEDTYILVLNNFLMTNRQ